MSLDMDGFRARRSFCGSQGSRSAGEAQVRSLGSTSCRSELYAVLLWIVENLLRVQFAGPGPLSNEAYS